VRFSLLHNGQQSKGRLLNAITVLESVWFAERASPSGVDYAEETLSTVRYIGRKMQVSNGAHKRTFAQHVDELTKSEGPKANMSRL
jgi:hypothetical protein